VAAGHAGAQDYARPADDVVLACSAGAAGKAGAEKVVTPNVHAAGKSCRICTISCTVAVSIDVQVEISRIMGM
jgi:hypothetical protein